MTKTYRIDRSKWVVQADDVPEPSFLDDDTLGHSRLLNPQGRMCCLGHICKQIGYTDNALFGAFMPNGLTYIAKARIAGLVNDPSSSTNNSKLASAAAQLNDNRELTVAETERKLVDLFADNDITLEFHGVLHASFPWSKDTSNV